MNFELCIGIDYSGAKTPVSRSSALQVYESRCGEEPQPCFPRLRPTNRDAIGVGVRSRIGWPIEFGKTLHSSQASIMASRFQSATLSVTDSGLGISF